MSYDFRIVQRALQAAGFSPGPIDGDPGRLTGEATLAALAALRTARGFKDAPAPSPPPPSASAPSAGGPIPADWLPAASMLRVIVHWTAGRHDPSMLDREHYHILIDGKGSLVRGKLPISANRVGRNPAEPYAAHTLNANGGAIGVALCGMLDAQERPFQPGPYPLTPVQWAMLARVLAQLSQAYAIPILPRSVLTHAEVQNTLGIAQRGKWDIARLPFSPLVGARAIGDAMRADALAANR